MNKIFILDDRLERRKVLMSEKEISELTYCKTQGWLSIVTELPTSQQELELALSDYSMIAIHRSWMSDHSVENIIDEYTKRTHKYFIAYSGGISQNLLLNNKMRLNINAGHFYSSKLPQIIKKYVNGETKYPLLELLYGESWRLALLLEYRNILWLGGADNNFMAEFNLRAILINEGIVDEPVSMNKLDIAIRKEKYNFRLL